MKYAVFVTPCLFILAFILALMINGAFKGVKLIQNSRRDEDAERGRNLFCLNTMETKKETQGKEGKKI